MSPPRGVVAAAEAAGNAGVDAPTAEVQAVDRRASVAAVGAGSTREELDEDAPWLSFAGEFDEFIAAMRAGVTYANVHTSQFPGGEIRGQIEED